MAVDSPLGPVVPVGLVGDWINLGPGPLKDDTLQLSRDSSASGVIPWGPKFARISRWKLIFGSKDPVGTRADWRQGHTDGGDPDCLLERAVKGCVSMPMLCLGAKLEYTCTVFYNTKDSLLLATGPRYKRLGS